MIWDVAGAEEHFCVPTSYVRGAAGFLVVADGTRADTFDVAASIVEQIDRDLGPLPFVFVVNKKDLVDAWQADAARLDAMRPRSLAVVTTSAKTGEGVEDAFSCSRRRWSNAEIGSRIARGSGSQIEDGLGAGEFDTVPSPPVRLSIDSSSQLRLRPVSVRIVMADERVPHAARAWPSR